MFFQRDYILRMIQMMGDIMRRIRELMSELDQMKLLDDICRAHTGISLETAEGLTKESLTELLQPMPRLMMSEILYARAELFLLQEEEQSELLHKSLHLLASLWEEGPLCELRAARLLEIKGKLCPRLDSSELMDCARFLLEAECFSDMEDALFQAAERMPAGIERELLCEKAGAMLRQAAAATPKALAFARTNQEELLLSAQEMEAWDETH